MKHDVLRILRSKLGISALACTVLASAAAGATASTAAGATPGVTPGVTSQRIDVGRELRKLEASHNLRIGAYAFDTATGKTVGYRSGELFPFASTSKAMICADILQKGRRQDPGLLDRLIHYRAADLLSYAPETTKYLDTGLTVAQLCLAAITESDNTAANLLLKQIAGPAGLTRYFRELGDRISRLDRTEPTLNDWAPGERRDTTTPAAIGRDLQAVTLGNALARPDRERLIRWLRANTTGDKRIRAGLPKNWTVGDKTGTGAGYAVGNDIAIVWPSSGPHPTKPLIMAIYTNGPVKTAGADDAAVAQTATILARGLGKLP